MATAQENLGKWSKLRKRPPARSGHIAVCMGRYMLVWGGYTDRILPTTHMFMYEERYMDPKQVWIYDTAVEQWHCKDTEGEAPPATSGAVAVVYNHCLYIIGGHTHEGNTSAVHVLNLRTWTWTRVDIPLHSEQMSPRDKHAAWLHKDKVYVFGGYGPPLNGYMNSSGHYKVDSGPYEHRGWNDQLLAFDLSTHTWDFVSSTGNSPNERAAHAVAMLDDNAYLFGGRHGSNRLNDLYTLNMTRHHWSGRLLVGGDQPEGRSWHSFTPISDRHIFLYGGYSTTGAALSDAWLLNTVSLDWQKLHDVPNNNPRLWHKACFTQDQDLLIFGGCCNDILSDSKSSRHTDSLLTFRFCPKTLLRLSLDSAFVHRALEPLWETLPQSLCERLKEKLQYHNDGQSDLESDSEDKATTCVVA